MLSLAGRIRVVVDNDTDFDQIIKMVHNIMVNSINQFDKIRSNFEQ